MLRFGKCLYMEKLSVHDVPLKSSSQMVHHTSVEFSQANSLVSLQNLYESALFTLVKSVLRLLAILKTNTWISLELQLKSSGQISVT